MGQEERPPEPKPSLEKQACAGLQDQIGSPCQKGEGQCQTEGTWRCDPTTDLLQCDATAAAPQTERCNGKDDDCDGAVDEELNESCFGGPPGSKDVGPCKAGVQTCDDGTWSGCQGEVLPKAEDCNGIDDDCDGQIDEDLTRDCYDGPAGTKGVGPCKAGVQRCKGGAWSSCEGQVAPKAGQSCLPILTHQLDSSLLTCLSAARSQACEPSGSCETQGQEKSDETRDKDDELFVRCRSNHTKTCGAYSSEAVARRELKVLDAKDGSLSLLIAASVGSCACNSWCRQGCPTGAGCCLSCSITARDCKASASYLGYHRFSWKEPLPAGFPMVLEVVELKGGAPTFARKSAEPNGSDEAFALQPKKRCSFAIDEKGVTLSIINSLGLSCADAKDFAIQLTLRPHTPGAPVPPSCLKP